MSNSNKVVASEHPATLGEGSAIVSVTASRFDTGSGDGNKTNRYVHQTTNRCTHEDCMSQPIEIKLPWPAPVLRSNASHGKHWGPKAAATKKARSDASIMARLAGLGSPVACWPTATIHIEYYPPARRGDPQNVPSSLKAYIDGIADAMDCDDRCFKVDFPRVFAGTKKGGEVVFRVYER